MNLYFLQILFANHPLKVDNLLLLPHLLLFDYSLIYPDAIPNTLYSFDEGYQLVEQMEVALIFYNDLPITLELPITVDLKVSSSPPGVKGDTATGATKQATLETGLELQVPLFVNEGDVIKIDTRTGQYSSRA